ncbi:MAG TPA: hypothetical protein VK473_15285 [Terriglobales bacterium]|nr:hypothetical protein [Terriglobales bacterium]
MPFIDSPLAVLAFSGTKPNLDLEDDLAEDLQQVCPVCGEILYEFSSDDWPQRCPECGNTVY